MFFGSEAAYNEYLDERNSAPATMSDIAGEYHRQGLPCPFDCAACDMGRDEDDTYADLALTLGCGHEPQRSLSQSDPHGDTAPREFYCYRCQGVQRVVKAVVLMPTPYVPMRKEDDPWANWVDPFASPTPYDGSEPPF